MIVLSEFIVQLLVEKGVGVELGEVGRHVGPILVNARSDCGDVHVDQERIISINLIKFVLSEVLGVDIVLNIHVFVGKDHVGGVSGVAGSLEVVDLQILILFLRVEVEEKAAVAHDLGIGIGGQGGLLFLAQFFLQATGGQLLLDNLVDLILYFSHLGVIKTK